MHHPEIRRDDQSSLAEMLKAIDEGRFRLISVHESAIIGIFNAAFSRPRQLVVPVFDELPEGYYVYGCHADWMTRSLTFQVFHPSFDATENCSNPVRAYSTVQSSIVVDFK